MNVQNAKWRLEGAKRIEITARSVGLFTTLIQNSLKTAINQF